MAKTQSKEPITLAPMSRFALAVIALIIQAELVAQTNDPAQIYLDLQKLNTVGSVLYIAAHPDDENTSLISTLESGYHVRTAYLSLTRGDGGQNLIGSEQNEVLGIIRTQELLAARAIDGAEQYFTRAVDFGYSKSAEETLQFWGHDEILSDIVWVIRRFRPDVIITRFAPAKYEQETHGHHSASAILAEEAFHAAGDPKQFPEQLQHVDVWQPKRLYWNVSRFFNIQTAQLDTVGQVFIDVGAYDPILGESYASLAARARSMHKSQGFGASPYLGSLKDRLIYVAGDRAEKDLFDGIDLSWRRVKGGEKVQDHIQRAIDEFDFRNPTAVLPHLLAALRQLTEVAWGELWLTKVKRPDLNQLILNVAGIHIEANAPGYYAMVGDSVIVDVSIVNGSGVVVQAQMDSSVSLVKDVLYRFKEVLEILPDEFATRPYWLRTPRTRYGRFELSDIDAELLGNAWNQPDRSVLFYLVFEKGAVLVDVPVTYKWTDRVKGEQVRPFIIMPPVTASFDEKTYFFPDSAWKIVNVTLKAWADETAGEVALAGAAGWKASPSKQSFRLKKGEEVTLPFRIGPKMWSTAVLAVTINGELAYSPVEINYDHIPNIIWLPNTGAIVSSAEIKITAKKVGYIMGAGDEGPAALAQLGCDVTMITKEKFDELDLKSFDAIVAGVRAYNTETWLPSKQKKLMAYVHQGGNYVVQYQTTSGLLVDQLGPYPMKIGRDRVTDENSPVVYSNRDHPILSYPNRLTPFDFNGWVQERGLYFADRWDPHYDSVLTINDAGEESLHGALLACTYGEGTFVYTGLSFFRQLPVGVSGAYRLWANILSYGSRNED